MYHIMTQHFQLNILHFFADKPYKQVFIDLFKIDIDKKVTGKYLFLQFEKHVEAYILIYALKV